MTRQTPRRIAALLLAGALIAACSSDDDAADTTVASETTSTASEPEATDAPESTEASPDTEPVDTEPVGDFDPHSQTLEWTECDAGECAEATVPTDYADPSAGTTTIELLRLPASGDPGDRVGTLFVNPGGPGEPGVAWLEGSTEFFSPAILEAFDIVGFDPRGVGQSDPLECLDDDGLDEFVAADVDADDPASVAAYGELVVGLGDACLDTNPELSKHVTTVETAMDIDVLRQLVGDDELHYFGGSYGTMLGATYAALFPDKVGRLVLDGAVDPTLAVIQNDLRQAGGFQLAFDDYAEDCAANACPLGSSVEEVEQTVSEMFGAALAEPLPTDDPERSLTRSLAFFGVIAPLYDQESWPALTEGIVAANDGDGTVLLGYADQYWGRTDIGYVNNSAESNKAITCLDEEIAPDAESIPTEDDFVSASSLFGEIYYGLVEVECEGWPIEATVEFPDYTAAGAAPILVVGTTGDPATPIESAHVLAGLLDSGVLLIREGEGHTAYIAGNPCINDIIDAYLVEGTVPDDGTTCSEDGELVDTTAPTTTAASTTTVPDTTTAPDTAPPITDGGDASGGGPEGTVTMTVAGNAVFEGQISQCTIADPDVEFLAQGETGEMEVGADAGGGVFVSVTGASEFDGKGTATFDPATAGIDTGDVTIAGTGAQPDDSAPVEDFVVEASVVSC